MTPEEIMEKVLHLARGGYQHSLLRGWECWSGATLRGSAKMVWGASYAASRLSLEARLSKYCLHTEIVLTGEGTSRRWRRMLIYTSPEGERRTFPQWETV